MAAVQGPFVSPVFVPIFHEVPSPLSQPVAGVSSPTAASTIVANSGAHAKESGVLGKVSAWFASLTPAQVAKGVVVALVIAGLITASVFTFGAAGVAFGALAWGGSSAAIITSFVATGALFGTGVGLVTSAAVSGYIAYKNDMFKDTEHNLEDVGKFLGWSFLASVLITGASALSGADEGLRYGILAMIIGGLIKK